MSLTRHPTPRIAIVRRLMARHGLSEPTARLVANLHFGRVTNG